MKKKVAFVCIHNSCRSQMAEAWAKNLGSDVLEAYSAGTEEYPEVKPGAVQVMEESDVNMSEHYPKLLSDIPEEIDILVTMGCGVECPYVPCDHREDWGLEDPSGGPIEAFRNTRNIIKEKVEDLIQRVKNKELIE
jgi:arsenate reductase (thioredoxin)